MFVSSGKAEVSRAWAATWPPVLVALVLLLLAGCALGHVAGRLAGQAGVPGGGSAAGATAGPGGGPGEVSAALVAARPEALAPGTLPPGKGQLLLAVRWPARYRAQVIPGTATRALFAARKGQATVATTSVSRPAGAATSTASLDLDAGTYTLIATAAAETRAVATGSAPITVVAGARTAASLTLAEAAIAYTVSTLAGGSYADGASSDARFSMVGGLAFDAAGNLYEADTFNNRIRKITPDGTVTTLAGDGVTGFSDGPAATARFHRPLGICVDASGNVYVGDASNNRIRKIAPSGDVSTVAGDGNPGFAEGAGTSARFNRPLGIALDASGTLYVADRNNHRIRRVAVDGTVTTLAGDGTAGFADGASSSARFNLPISIAVDATGVAYVGEYSNRRVRKIAVDGTVSTLAGDGATGSIDGAGISARFTTPAGLAVDSSGVVYVADMSTAFSRVEGVEKIRRISPDGQVSTLAGDGGLGLVDGATSSARFGAPKAIALAPDGTIYVGEAQNRVIRKIVAGTVSTFAGAPSFRDGPSGSALFAFPEGIARDAGGNLVVADMWNSRVRKISPAGLVTTLAGDGLLGFTDGAALAARFKYPYRLAAAPDGTLFVADGHNHRIRKVSPAGVVGTVAGDGSAGFADASGAAARFNNPSGLALDVSANLYVADQGNSRIRKVAANGDVSTFAGDGTYGFADGSAAIARFRSPVGLAIDTADNLYVADSDNHRIRKISPAGAVSTVAGDGTAGFADGATSSARFNLPRGVAVDGAGNVLVADTNNSRIRRISPDGQVTTLAGDGAQAHRDGSPQQARFIFPVDLVVGDNLDVYVVDRWANAIRVLR
ncbi:MAG: hypothetical protein FJZ01_22860 [Candidatus Sericytochromatia bacterium]|nr:hypothetical protein [Candidatus Tanganyikabacteria bacterium]